MAKIDESELISGLRKGRDDAYEELFERHYVVLCQLAAAYLHDDAEAQLLVDELMIHLYERRESLVITTSLRAYLVRAVRNRCLNYLTSEQRQREINLTEMGEAADYLLNMEHPDQLPSAVLLEKELEKEIRQAVFRLPTETRTVFQKSRYELKSYQEIATELGISVNTVKYHIKNAIAHLFDELKEYLPVLALFL
jgi:RNA polymerase sigma-70 factor (ECF subfamily)